MPRYKVTKIFIVDATDKQEALAKLKTEQDALKCNASLLSNHTVRLFCLPACRRSMAHVARALLRAPRRLPWRRALVAGGERRQPELCRVDVARRVGSVGAGPQPVRPAHAVDARLLNALVQRHLR